MGKDTAAYLETLRNFSKRHSSQRGLNLEKLQANPEQKIYTIRHNLKSRLALCPVKRGKHQYWIVVDVLPDHEYHKLQTLNKEEESDLDILLEQYLAANAKAAAESDSDSKEDADGPINEDIGADEEADGPEIEVSENIEFFDNTYILFDETQGNARKEIKKLPLIISGAPGAGKTSVLLSMIKDTVLNEIYNEEPLPILVLAKSKNLVAAIQTNWDTLCQSELRDLSAVHRDRVLIKTPEDLYAELYGPTVFRGELQFMEWYLEYSHAKNLLRGAQKKSLLPAGKEEASLIYHELQTMSGYDTYKAYEDAINSKFSLFDNKETREALWQAYEDYKRAIKKLNKNYRNKKPGKETRGEAIKRNRCFPSTYCLGT